MRRFIPCVLFIALATWSCSKGEVGPALPQASFTSASQGCDGQASCDAIPTESHSDNVVAEPMPDTVAEVPAPPAPMPTPTPTLTPIPKAPAPTLVTYNFQVDIASGSLTGKSYRGSFTYDPKLATGADPQTVTAMDFKFDYLIGAELVVDAPAKITLVGGKATQLTVVGGPAGKRFGINLGFDRNQFGLPTEAFVRNGEQYFGYLNANAIVDGAGRVSYTLVPAGP
ncbi:MAG TPA: hypothetical protein VFO10_30395 [Oligoflexus sp.]|uniref:hypothetical protein n=1 Tax=Oligoflexus sp. TaxID=1971216 RepID=UPI002D80BC9E|nr:hypothetical protein [Oligoflexus sp.]HET9241616.1 hypothetical protein [Oligoflexus sp.]